MSKVDRALIKHIMLPYYAGDFATFVRKHCAPDCTYELVPGDLSPKLDTAQKQHEFARTFVGHYAASNMILEGLTGNEVKVGIHCISFSGWH